MYGLPFVRRNLSAFASILLTFMLGCEFVDSDGPKAPDPIVAKRYNLIPLPKTVVERDGQLELGPGARIATSGSDPDLARVALQLATDLRAATGYAISVDEVGATTPATIELALDGSTAADERDTLDADAAAM